VLNSHLASKDEVYIFRVAGIIVFIIVLTVGWIWIFKRASYCVILHVLFPLAKGC